MSAAREWATPVKDLYFIEAANGYIKIGLSVNPTRRLRTLQSNSPIALRLLGVIAGSTVFEERRIHDLFASQRQHGEWFAPSVELHALAQQRVG